MKCWFTFPPCMPLTAKQKSVDSLALPGILNCEKDAACPKSTGCKEKMSLSFQQVNMNLRFK